MISIFASVFGKKVFIFYIFFHTKNMRKFGFKSDVILDYKETEYGSFKPVSKTNNNPGDLFNRVRVVLGENNEYNKKAGEYITLNLDYSSGVAEYRKKFIVALSKEIKRITKKAKNILCIGIGNSSIISDSLGPKVVNLLQNSTAEELACCIKSFAPNVVGNTGIDSYKIVKLLTKELKPDVVIIIDSLCSRMFSRIGSSFQLSTAGIVPGSGVGTNNMELTENTLGTKVLAIGVPTVVYLKSLLFEIFESLNAISKIDVSKIPYDDIYVSPKEIDLIINDCADLIYSAIKRCFSK